MTVVGITGVAGCLGRQLLQQMEVDPDISGVVGLDLKPVPDPALKLSYYQRDIAQPFAELFQRHKVQVAVHLAATADPDRGREEATNLEGTRQFLAACHEASARVVCVVSSAMAYGARPGPTEVQYEGAPLRTEQGPEFVRDKMRVEELCYEYVKTHPDVCLQIVRPCLVIGPGVDNFLTRMLDRRVVLAPMGADPPLQLVHEDDATRAIYRLIKTERVGVFNVAGDGVLTLSQMARLAEKRVVRLPLPLLRLFSWLGWRLGLSWFPRIPPGLWSFLRWPWLVAPLKLRTEAAFLFRYDSPQAFLDWLENRSGGELPRSPEWDAFPEDLDDVDELIQEELPPGAEAPAGAPAEDETPTPVPAGWSLGEPGSPAPLGADEPTPQDLDALGDAAAPLEPPAAQVEPPAAQVEPPAAPEAAPDETSPAEGAAEPRPEEAPREPNTA